MVRANTTIIAGGKTFHSGQNVTGLSGIDREWMKKAGYITDVKREKPAENQTKAEDKKDEL